MQTWHEEVDFLIVGSGAGGMTAAITAQAQGLRTLLIEKSAVYGGTSALSGGVIWIPNNPHMHKANIADSAEDAWQYLSQVVSDDVPTEKIKAYIKHGPEMLSFIEANSLLKYDPAPVYPDYYAELKGGKNGARSLDPRPYTIRQMGEQLAEQMRSTDLDIKGQFSMTADEAHQVFSFTWRSPIVIFQCLLRYWLDIPARLKKWPDNRLTLGRALVGRLRHTMEQKNIPLWLNTSATELIKEGDRVVGVVAQRNGQDIAIKANKGVLIASGGFSKNQTMREQHHPHPSNSAWSAASSADTGDGIKLAQAINAATDMMTYAWWSPTLVLQSGAVEAFIVGKSMPSCMVVNKAGKRFLNEAEPYEDFVKHQYQAHKETPSIPAFFIFDSRYRHEYPVGTAMAPGKYQGDGFYKELFASGWVVKADSLEELAQATGIDVEGLQQTTQRMAEFAKTGDDKDFAKGSVLNDRYYSDHRIKPNPCLAPIEKAPFYAVKIWPGDLGTKGGVLTNELAQVLTAEGEVIEGLYATGNVTASVMGDSYPGAGSTLGPAMTFAYIAAKHAAMEK